MHDAVIIEDAGLPCSLLLTKPFLPIRDRVAQMLGVPGYPATILAHPLSIRDRESLRAEAQALAPEIVSRLIDD